MIQRISATLSTCNRQKLLPLVAIGAVVITLLLLLYPSFSDTTGTTIDVKVAITFSGVVLLGAMIKGVTGMGFGLVTAPFAPSIIDPQTGFIILTIPTFALCLFQIAETGTAGAFLRKEPTVILTALFGSSVGVYLLGSVSMKSFLSVALAGVLLLYTCHQISNGIDPVERTANPYLKAIASTSHGITFGAFNLGPLFPAYFHSYERDVDRYIGGIAVVTALILAEKLALLVSTGLLGPRLAWYGTAVTVIAFFGIGVGSLVRPWVDEETIHRGIIILVTIAALILLSSPISSLF